MRAGMRMGEDYTPGLVSLISLTIDRFALSRDTITTNIKNAQDFAPMELLVADNGSKDRQIVQWVAGHPLTKYHRRNSTNEGVGRAFNQLYLRARGEFICFMGSDLELPPGWLKEMLGYSKGIPNSGIIGMDWGHGGVPPYATKFGIHAHWLTPKLDKVFGVWFMRRQVIETVGLFHEGFHPYGLEDSDFNNRVTMAGFNSCYVPSQNFKCKHVGTDQHDTGEYRKMKDESLGRNLPLFNDRVAHYHDRGIVEPLPPMREPL